jgi:hypothetical protein
MSSIGSTLNSINSSLLSEISSFNAKQSQTSTSSATSTAAAPDKIDLSQVGELFKELKQLQTDNPTELKQVLNDAATQLKSAASQATDPQQAAFLNNLAGKFQTAAATGNLSDLQQGSSSSGANGLYSAHGHHHHHGGGAKPAASDQSQTSVGSVAST